jgi:hypothetical protein
MTDRLIVPFNAYAAIELSLSRDCNRLSISVVTRQRDQWIGGGPVASIPSTMIDTAIDALHQMRDRLAQGGGR